MLRSLHIQNFRALREFRMSGLGRVNLLVGTNNCGKTSVLEAIQLLTQGGIEPIIDAHARRGERSAGGDFDATQLFHGRRLQPGSEFSIRDTTLSLTARARSIEKGELFTYDWAPEDVPALALALEWRNGAAEEHVKIALDVSGSLLMYNMHADASRRRAVFVSTRGVSSKAATEWLGDVLLTEEEEMVLMAMRTIEPDLQRIAAVGLASDRTSGRIAVNVRGQRAPIGSMGDGIWRLFGIALAMVRAKGSVLLVDEIDTGLHYAVLEKMWRLVFETAQRLDVQVFATTHSRDCYEALAAIATRDRHEVSIQRIERDKPEAVAFDEAEILVAAERGIEVR